MCGGFLHAIICVSRFLSLLETEAELRTPMIAECLCMVCVSTMVTHSYCLFVHAVLYVICAVQEEYGESERHVLG